MSFNKLRDSEALPPSAVRISDQLQRRNDESLITRLAIANFQSQSC
ncbi:hypothetical protein [uncultured Nostoc sp.]